METRMDSDKILDRVLSKAEHLADIALKAGVAWTGYRATNHWSGGLTGLVALRLAQSPNLAAGLAGTGMLAWLGLSAFVSPEGDVRAPDMVKPIIPGTVYIPPGEEENIVIIDTQVCTRRGGEIVMIIPMTNLCHCRLPVVSGGFR